MKKQLTKRVYASVYDKCVKFIDKENEKVKNKLKKSKVKNAVDAIKNLSEEDKKAVLAKLQEKNYSDPSQERKERDNASDGAHMTYL